MDHTDRDRAISNEFIAVYNQLDGWMRSILKEGNDRSFSAILKELATRYPAIDRNYKFLQDMADVRNLVVHTSQNTGVGLAVPTQAVVDEFRGIAAMITDPPALLSYSVKNVQVRSVQDSLSSALREMGAHDYSQLLVKDSNGTHRLLTREGIAAWLEQSIEDDLVSIGETTVEQVIRFEDEQACRFLGRGADIWEGLNAFSDPKRRIQAIVLTQHGRASEQPLGLVTAYDIARIAISWT